LVESAPLDLHHSSTKAPAANTTTAASTTSSGFRIGTGFRLVLIVDTSSGYVNLSVLCTGLARMRTRAARIDHSEKFGGLEG